MDPIFMKIYLLCGDDAFWKSVFKDIANNNLPFAIFVDDTYLYYGDGLKYDYKANDDLYQVKRDIQNIFEAHLMTRKPSRVNFDTWKSIKNKSIKHFLIMKYLLENATKHHVEYRKVLKLYKLLKTCLYLKLLTKDDIEFDPDTFNITYIKGVDFTSDTVVNLYLNLHNVPEISVDSQKRSLFK